MFMTPLGRPASWKMEMRALMLWGANSEAFKMAVFPAATGPAMERVGRI
jgi:hypothetical protein